MKNLILSALLLSGLTAFSQKQHVQKLTDSVQVVYDLGDDGRTKDGLYAIKNTKSNGVIVQGHYRNGTRVGTWYYFDSSNKLTLRYNFDDKKVIYLDKDQLKNVDVLIKSNDDNVKKGASIPVPLCPIDFLSDYVKSKIYDLANAGGGAVETAITAHVYTNGKAKYFISYKTENGSIEKQTLNLDNYKFTVDWVPSMYNGQSVESDFTIFTKVGNNNQTFRRFKWY